MKYSTTHSMPRSFRPIASCTICRWLPPTSISSVISITRSGDDAGFPPCQRPVSG